MWNVLLVRRKTSESCEISIIIIIIIIIITIIMPFTHVIVNLSKSLLDG